MDIGYIYFNLKTNMVEHVISGDDSPDTIIWRTYLIDANIKKKQHRCKTHQNSLDMLKELVFWILAKQVLLEGFPEAHASID